MNRCHFNSGVDESRQFEVSEAESRVKMSSSYASMKTASDAKSSEEKKAQERRKALCAPRLLSFM